MTRMLRALVALALVVLTLGAVTGCGSSSGGSGTDTAKLAPASSFFYAEVTIDPTGSQEAAMRTILADLPGSGAPQDRLNNLLEQASKSSKTANVDYAKDVKPWLGDKAAVFVSEPPNSTSTPPWAVLLATTDEGKAKDTISKGKESSDRDASYRGTDYVVSKDGTAVGVVGGFVVIGSEKGLHAAVDASKGQSLSSADRYKQATQNAASERIALVYEDLGGLLQAAANAGGQSLGPAAPLIGQLFGSKPVVATVRAENQALVIDGNLLPTGSFLHLQGGSTQLLGEVPGDSWLALGMANFGQTVKSMLGLVATVAGGEQALEQQLRTAAGIDLQKDVLSWIGDVAFFVSGNSKDTIAGGALIKSTDPAASKRALTKFAALAAKSSKGIQVSAAKVGNASGYRLQTASAPHPIYMLQAGDTVAFAYGDAAARAAFGGGSTLGNSSSFQAAASKLGGGYSPTLYVTVPPILNLAESFGASSANYQKAKQYLSILDYVIAGSAKSGSGVAARTRIAFKPHS